MKLRASPMLLLGIAVLMLCSACNLGGGSSNDQKYGYVRLINAINPTSNSTTAPSIKLTIDSSDDDDYAISSVAAASASDYTRVKVNSYSLVVAATDASLSASSTSSISVSDDGEDDKDYHYSVVAYQRGGVIKFVTIQESETDPNSGFANITAINAGSDAGTVDVYVVPPGTSSLSELSPVFGALSSSSTSQAQSTSTGTYDIVVTAKDKKSDVRLRLNSVTLTDKEIVTLILTPTPGGALLDGVLVKNQGAATMASNSYVRVRIAAAFDTTQTVLATADGGTTISVSSPSVGSYSLIPATDSIDVTVNGTTTASDLTFSKGRDYTILAYDSTTPTVTLLEDNNQIPSSGAKIRLVNAAVPAAGVTLKNNSTTVFSQITYGEASDYSGISSGSATLRLSSLASNFTIESHDWGDTDTSYTTSITSGNVYTLFLLGKTDGVIATLNGDRTDR